MTRAALFSFCLTATHVISMKNVILERSEDSQAPAQTIVAPEAERTCDLLSSYRVPVAPDADDCGAGGVESGARSTWVTSTGRPSHLK